MKKLVIRCVREESGQDLIEYGLLIGVITAAAITAIDALGPKVAGYYSNLNSRLPWCVADRGASMPPMFRVQLWS
jgi:pilus assembly protein Flp/PilA